jgi:hypothetical protein
MLQQPLNTLNSIGQSSEITTQWVNCNLSPCPEVLRTGFGGQPVVLTTLDSEIWCVS